MMNSGHSDPTIPPAGRTTDSRAHPVRRAGPFLWRAGIVLLWVASTAAFVRFEAFPEVFTHTARGYRDFFSKGTLVKDSWMKLTFKGAPIGYSHTSVDTDEQMVSSRYRMENETSLNFNRMGFQERVTARTEAVLDAMYRLQTFSLFVSTRFTATRILGRRGKGNVFRIRTESGGGTSSASVTIPDDVVIYSPGTDIALAGLKPGERLTIRTLEPLSMKPAAVTIRALPRETISIGGVDTNVAVLSTEYMGSSAKSWIAANGDVLRQETLIRDMMAEACTPREAMAADKGSVNTDDILNAVAIVPNVRIRDPSKRDLLRYRLAGPGIVSAVVGNRRQIVERTDENSVLLRVASSKLPRTEPASAINPADFAAELEATAYIQSDNPEIRAAAARIVGNAAGPVAAATAICDWVHRSVDKEPSAGIPSALEVLRIRKGDCNEHTYLFVALARAANLPSKVVIGLAYSESYGAFCYHAWPAVYAGEWIEMDPTFGTPTVDAAHIALIEGELPEQFKLISVIGRLSLEILQGEDNDKS